MPREERWRKHKYKLHAPKSGHRHYVLEYARLRKSGNYGKYESWPLKTNVPMWIFKWLLKRCTDLQSAIHADKKTYAKEFPKITDTLVRNGIAQGFKAHRRRDYGDVTWYLHGKPIATFMIADLSPEKQIWGNAFKAAQKVRDDKRGEGKRFKRMERKSKAPMRLVWVVSCDGKWFRLGIGKMRTRKGD